MKKIIAAGVLLFIVVISYFTAAAYIKNIYTETTELLEKCITAYEENNNPEKAAKDLNRYWEEHEPTLSIVANHNRIDEIELSISSIEIYSKTKEKEIFYEYTGTLETQLHQLIEDTLPSLHSIL